MTIEISGWWLFVIYLIGSYPITALLTKRLNKIMAHETIDGQLLIAVLLFSPISLCVIGICIICTLVNVNNHWEDFEEWISNRS